MVLNRGNDFVLFFFGIRVTGRPTSKAGQLVAGLRGDKLVSGDIGPKQSHSDLNSLDHSV